MSNLEKQSLVVIVGPTGVGKTEISIKLAEEFNGEIISADSRTFYRGMDIGTAKPSYADRLRIKHHLIDFLTPDQDWSMVLFKDLTFQLISQIGSKGKLPFLVGGTGQYIKAITHNWLPPSIKPNLELRKKLEELSSTHGTQYLVNFLSLLDPETATIIDIHNPRRLVRALEVILVSGRKLSEQKSSGKSPFNLITIGVNRPREELYQRIDNRIDEMFKSGFLHEVDSLLKKGYSPQLPSLSAIGYQECSRVLSGEISLEEANKEIKRRTRIYVRRQANWFKPADPTIKWFNLSEQSIFEIIKYIYQMLQK